VGQDSASLNHWVGWRGGGGVRGCRGARRAGGWGGRREGTTPASHIHSSLTRVESPGIGCYAVAFRMDGKMINFFEHKPGGSDSGMGKLPLKVVRLAIRL
jgi:hypothetical protein